MSFRAQCVVLLAIMSLLPGTNANSQVVAKRDLAEFYGKFAHAIAGNRDSIDVTRFAEWHIAPRSKGAWEVANKKVATTSDGIWVYINLLHQEGDNLDRCYSEYDGQGHQTTNFWYFMMTEACGYSEGTKSVLTVWKQEGRDSLRFECAQIGEFDCGIGLTWVEKIEAFPDSSLLLYTRWFGADGGEFWGSDAFYRSESRCGFRPFYHNWWGSTLVKKVHYDAGDLSFGRYRILELTDFRSPDSALDFAVYYQMQIDSAKARVIDLWQIAVDSLRIDTLAVHREDCMSDYS